MSSRQAIGEFQEQSAVDDFDGTGGEWTTFAECFPDIRPLRGLEQFSAAQVQSRVNAIIETELIDGVTSRMRLRVPKPEPVNEDEPEHDDNYRFFEIESVINVNEANRSMELMAIEKL